MASNADCVPSPSTCSDVNAAKWVEEYQLNHNRSNVFSSTTENAHNLSTVAHIYKPGRNQSDPESMRYTQPPILGLPASEENAGG